MLRVEIGLIVLGVLIACIRPSLGSGWLDHLERRFSSVAQRQTFSVVLVGVLALALRAAVLPVEPIPEPVVHDEFGYLLAADTFAHGRLTNATPPMWQHFETFSILMKPTYQCFAQPAQGMMLALGQVIFGHPFWGVWLSCGLMCAAITWTLQAWLPPEWALLGGLVSVLRFGVFGYWADSYWGGAVGAIGGALVLGALPRIKESQRVRDALLMGVGLTILANSRPFEGFVFSLPVAVVLIGWLLGKKSPALRVTVPRVVVPLTLVLAFAAAGLGYYVWRVTGSPFRMPYQVERETYGVAPFMLWQKVRPEPVYNHAVMRNMYVGEELVGYKSARLPVVNVALKATWAGRFFLGPLFAFPFLVLICTLPYNLRWRDISANTRFLLIVLGVVACGHVVATFYNPHYSGPVTCIVIALVVAAVRRMSGWRHGGQQPGRFLVRTFPLIAIFVFIARAVATPAHIPLSEFYEPAWYQKSVGEFGRSDIEKELEHLPGPQLVMVRYKPNHEPFAEWVYNHADIENAKVVWAREMGGTEDQQLLARFRDRRVWLLEADEMPPRLTPYVAAPEMPVPQNQAAQVNSQ